MEKDWRYYNLFLLSTVSERKRERENERMREREKKSLTLV
jgi:hypothetical protein